MNRNRNTDRGRRRWTSMIGIGTRSIPNGKKIMKNSEPLSTSTVNATRVNTIYWHIVMYRDIDSSLIDTVVYLLVSFRIDESMIFYLCWFFFPFYKKNKKTRVAGMAIEVGFSTIDGHFGCKLSVRPIVGCIALKTNKYEYLFIPQSSEGRIKRKGEQQMYERNSIASQRRLCVLSVCGLQTTISNV